MKKEKKQKQFSKKLLVQESILIWIITLTFIALAFICVMNGFIGELPWLTTMVAFPWGAYGVSQAAYYHKSTKENTAGGITYETAVNQLCCEYEEEEYEE
jgi:EamA domain-containing membrane protein RarD